MSILNAFISKDLGLLGVDTEAILPDGSIAEVCKLVALPHLSAAVGTRGPDIFAMSVAGSLVACRYSFDDLAKNLPNIMEVAINSTLSIGISEEECACELVLVGHSVTAQKIVGHQASKRPGGGIEVSTGWPQLYAPFWCGDEIQALGIVADRAGMVSLAKKQCEWARARGPAGNPAGGRFMVAEIRKGSVLISEACEFPARAPQGVAA